MKRQSTECKKIFSNNISEKGLIFKTHIKNTCNSTTKKQTKKSDWKTGGGFD